MNSLLLFCSVSLLGACAQQSRQADGADVAILPDTDAMSSVIQSLGERDPRAAVAQPPLQCTPETGVAWIDPSHDDIWARIRYGFQLNLFFDNPRISAELDWFGSHQKYIDRVTDRASPYLHHVVKEVERHNLPMEIALLPIVESAYDPFAYSHGKAAGMWQFISSTGELYGLKQNWWYDGRRDIRESTRAAIAYLSYLSRHYDGDWELALAAYNTGQGNVDRAIRRNRKKGLATDFWSLKLPKETRAYVPRLLAVARIIADPADYGITLKPVANQPYFTAVNIGSQIDLAEASRMAGISTKEMYRLNPGFNRWATDPKGPYQLLIPISQADQFSSQLAEQIAGNKLKWQRHTVESGDTLSLIAERYNSSVNAISQVNRLTSSTIQLGRTLIIPLAGNTTTNAGTLTPPRGRAYQPRRIDYQVRAGDSIWKIARRFNVSQYDVSEWNELSSGEPLLIGKQLVLWLDPQASQSQNSVNQALPAPYIRKVGYTVKNGDTLSEIASKFNVNLVDLHKWNPTQKAGGLRPGQRITLYVDITKAR